MKPKYIPVNQRRRVPFVPPGSKPFPRRLGAINLAPGGASVSPQQGALKGAAAGSAWGPIGTVIGAAAGTLVGLLSSKPNTAAHIGNWDGQIAQAVASMPAAAAGIGRQFPWNENSHGLVQWIEALLAVGIYMAWDSSILSNYEVCEHWATTFGAAVQQVATAVIQNPVGAKVSLTVPVTPGANHGPISFSFVNPGIGVGPDRISATVIMGSAGLMYAMIIGLGETASHASSNANNGSAQKVYAYMIDYVAAQLAPAAAQPAKPAPVIAPAVVAASTAVNAAIAAAPPATATIQPIAAAPVAQIQQQAPAPIIIQSGNGGNYPTPVAAAPTDSGLFGLSNTTLFIIGGVAVAAYMLSRK